MSALIAIGWFVWLIASLCATNYCVIEEAITAHRWWKFPALLLSYVNFAAMVLLNPF